MDILCSTKARALYSSSSIKRFMFLLPLKTAAGDLKVIFNSVHSSKYFKHFPLNFHCLNLDF